MDKYEYKLRLEEIKSLNRQGRFQEAAQVADGIDWKKVRNVSTLGVISDVYKVNRRFDDAKAILLLANEQSPQNRRILCSICDLTIKMGQVVEALEYYKEFVQLSPNDNNKYILLYKIYEAQDISLEERIAVLKEYKKREYNEKWLYELAFLYHRVGLATECVEECDQLILWFGEGKYVAKAMELKMRYVSLSPAQQQTYERIFGKRSVSEVTSDTVEEELDELKKASEQELQEEELLEEELDIQVKTMDMGKFNTMNLQAALAESMREVLDPTEESGPYIETSGGYRAGLSGTQEYSMEERGKYRAAEPVYEEQPEFYGSGEELPEEQSGENLREWDLRQTELSEQPGNRESYGVRTEMDAFLAQEYDGQIGLALQEKRPAEKQITGQMNIEDVLAEWETLKKQNEEKRRQETRRWMLQQTGSMFEDFEQHSRDGVLERLQREESLPIEEMQKRPVRETPFRSETAGGGQGGSAEGTNVEEMPMEEITAAETPMANVSVQGADNVMPQLSEADRKRLSIEALMREAEEKQREARELLMQLERERQLAAQQQAGQYMQGMPEQPQTMQYVQGGLEQQAAQYVQGGLEQQAAGQYVQDAAGQLQAAQYVQGIPGQPQMLQYAQNISGQPQAEQYAQNIPVQQAGQYIQSVSEQLQAGQSVQGDVGQMQVMQNAQSDLTQLQTAQNAQGNSMQPQMLQNVQDVSAQGIPGQPQMLQNAQGVFVQPQAVQTAQGIPVQPQMLQNAQGIPVQPQTAPGAQGISVQPQMLQNAQGIPVQPQTAPGAQGISVQPQAVQNMQGIPVQPQTVQNAQGIPVQPQAAPGVQGVPEQSQAGQPMQNVSDQNTAAQPVQSDPAQPAENIEDTQAMIQNKQLEEHERSMTQEEKDLFSPFLPTKSAMRQLIKALDAISLSAYTGNMIITGAPGTDMIKLAKSVVKIMRVRDQNFSGQIAKVSGDVLNTKNMAALVSKIPNGALIIDKGGKISAKGAADLVGALNQEQTGLIVFLLDTKRAVENLMEKNPQLAACFTARFDIAALDTAMLVKYGCQYAYNQEYSIDEMGRLALHTRIEEMQTKNHAVTVEEVKAVIDEAIAHAVRFSVTHFTDVLFRRRYDDDDMIILKERDFI